MNNNSNYKINKMKMNINIPNLLYLIIMNRQEKYQKAHFNILRKRVRM